MNKICVYNREIPVSIIPDTKEIHLQDIDTIDNDSVDEIFIQDLLDTVLPEQYDITLTKLRNKLKDNGVLHIQAPDLKQIAIATTFNKITIDLAQMILYRDRIFVHTAKNIKDLLINNDYKVIVQKYINIFEYYFMCLKSK